MANATLNGSTGLENKFCEPIFFFSVRADLIATRPSLSASLGINGERSAYVPPHLRGAQRAPPPPVSNGYALHYTIFFLSLTRTPRNGWAEPHTTPPPPRGGGGWGDAPRGGFGTDRGGGGFAPSRRAAGNDWAPNGGSGNWGASHVPHDRPRGVAGEGSWKDGKHIIGAANARLEKDLFGDATDPSKQHTGLNFEKYDDIPVEATGANVPEPVVSFTSPPLDPLLLENIKLARYNTPTPVQKYSIPVVLTAKSDLMG